jgi:hypothetical protein
VKLQLHNLQEKFPFPIRYLSGEKPLHEERILPVVMPPVCGGFPFEKLGKDSFQKRKGMT